MDRIGIIAGRGNFPLLLAQEAKKAGCSVMAIAVRKNTRRYLKKYVDKLIWIPVTEFRRIPGIFKEENIQKVALAGQINPSALFNPKVMLHPDLQDFFVNLRDRRADTIFNAFAGKLQDAGLELIDSTLFLSNYIPKKAVLTQRKPSDNESRDIALGFKIAKQLGSMDIGQSVCVKNGVILAVESIEGTNNTIRRAVNLVKSAVVLVKTSKPCQDMRFDVPVVGLQTIKNLPKGSCMTIESCKTLFLDQQAAIGLADRKSIAILADSL